jgi:hypothetical protein
MHHLPRLDEYRSEETRMDVSLELRNAQRRIIILGTSPIADLLVGSPEALAEPFKRIGFEELVILYESDDELYKQSMITGHRSSQCPVYFDELTDARNYIQGLGPRIRDAAGATEQQEDAPRLVLKQVTLRLPLSVIRIDDTYWVAFVSDRLPDQSDYIQINADHPWYERVADYLDFYISETKGAIYLFDPEKDKQLIQIYDNAKDPKPRGDAPRKAFYDNTDIQRRSVWGFVFSRDAKLLLHKRSEYTADNQAMWDKSYGGHVDTGEDSITTAKRELIEEFFLAAAEDTLHLREDLRLVRNMGDWSPPEGSESGLLFSHFRAAYEHLPENSWAMFMPILRGEPPFNRVIHTSKRYFVYSKGKWEWRNARFIADVFFLVAPSGSVLSEEGLETSLVHGTLKGAAAKHRLISVRDLLVELAQIPLETKKYTEDLYYVAENYRGFLIKFSNYVRRVFGQTV